MSPSSKMGYGLKQQRWEFRRSDSDMDSSSDESKSSSEAAHKKNNLVCSLIPLENDEAIGNCRVQQTGMSNPHLDDQIMFQKGKRVHLRKRKKDTWINNDMERDSRKEVSRKKSRTSVYDPAALDELKIFMESLLEDLKVTRENLFSWMRKEMQELVADDDAAPRLERRKGSSGGKNVRVQNGDNFVENTISKEYIQVHNKRKLEENIIIQHQNNFDENVLVQRESNSEQNACLEHQNKFKETFQVQHHGNFEKVDVQVNYRNNSDLGMQAQKCDMGSIERSVKSNTAAGYDNCYPLKPNFQSADKNVWMHHEKKYLSGTRAQAYSGRSLESPLIGRKMAQSNYFYPVIEHRVDRVQEIGAGTSSEKDRGERLGLPIESIFSSNLSSQVASSMYLSLPTVLTEPCVENHMLNTSSSNYIRTPFDRNKLDVNYGKANPMLKVNGHRGKSSGMQQEERNGSFAQLGSRNMSCFDKQCIPSSSIGTGFPVPLHQGTDIGVSIPSQVSLQYLPQEETNIMGLRMGEGASTLSGGSYAAISEGYLANTFYRNSISKAHDRLKAFQNQDLEEGLLFPK
ncbi:hypothetical protein CerSpe_180130 [Prunus speciosa]